MLNLVDIAHRADTDAADYLVIIERIEVHIREQGDLSNIKSPHLHAQFR